MENYKFQLCDKGKTLLSVIGAKHGAFCGGMGRCGKCLVRATGMLSSPDEQERRLISDKLDKGYRLACLTKVYGDFEYELSGLSETLIQTEYSGEINYSTDSGHIHRESSLLAVDIGTTTVVAYAVDRVSGRVFDKRAFLNPQHIHGADVISRIDFSVGGGKEQLKREISGSIKEAALEMFGQLPTEAVICGNTAISHFLCGYDVEGISKLPFTPDSLFGEMVETDFCQRTYVSPCVAAYVGGDITAGIMAAELDKTEKTVLYIDIGTNGEIVLTSNKRYLCCAAAAGPAFEGAGIECGMTASTGAVSRVIYEDGEFKYETVNDADAVGICGSGLISFAAALLESEELDETGHTEEERYYLSPTVFISQKDIRALQTAKAAITAGIDVLIYELGISVSKIDRVILAGGFGMHIDPKSACAIGLIPSELYGKIEFAGNMAGKGAVDIALTPDNRIRTENLASKMEYIELSGHKKFNELYIEKMMFE